MKTIASILIFFIANLVYSQDMIVEFASKRAKKFEKNGVWPVIIDDGKNPYRAAPIKANTPLAIINYFKKEGFKVEVHSIVDWTGGTIEGYGGRSVHQFYLLCYKKE